MLNKVPEVTFYFWIIKILCTTVGETASDYLSDNVGLGLTNTTFITGAALVAALVYQFRLRRYVPGVYWLGVVLISVVGTQITDNLTDNAGVSLVTTTVAFGIALALAFAGWYASERTLSIHTIYTTRREAFYWLTVLFTFALGTAAGDLTAERLSIGFWRSALVFGGAIAVVFLAHLKFRLNAITAFWIAYVLTRPLGASIGDYLSQARRDGGLALGTTATSAIFLSTILFVVVFLTITKRDRIQDGRPAATLEELGLPRVLVVPNRSHATSALVEKVRTRAAAGQARFVLLVPNPAHLAFDRSGRDVREGNELVGAALPVLEEAASGRVEARVARSPNAYDDIVEELGSRHYDEIILETVPSHVSHWLHVDLAQRLAHLGYPLETVAATG
ncbi:MAG TPA: hypothetical protein VFA66_16235 [Gaiellaceae bacterium]|nr:hypothetical protein [Gaiellaceae bacterium]